MQRGQRPSPLLKEKKPGFMPRARAVSVSELSEYSVAQGGMPQVFPDFTRGDWKTTAPLGIVQ